MVADALAADRFIGMIQPVTPGADNLGIVGEPGDAPDLHEVGCAGSIEHSLPEPDGRYHILLRGVTRFRLLQELAMERGYRRFQVGYEAFAADFRESEHMLDPSDMLRAMEVLKKSHSLSIDPEDFRHLSGIAVLNGLCAALPFAPGEKQALLEAADPAERERRLLALMTLGFQQGTGTRYAPPPTIH